MTTVSTEIRLNQTHSEAVKDDENIDKVMPDVKSKLMGLQHKDQHMKQRVSGGSGTTDGSLDDISAVLSEDGMRAHVSNVPSSCRGQGYDLVGASNIDWRGGDSTKAMLQLVHTDHPYLCQSSDDLQFPTKSTSCSSIPDAELMQDFFLHTTNMISYQPIAELGCQPAPKTATTLIGFDHGTSNTVLNTVATNQSKSQINQLHVGKSSNIIYKGSEYDLETAAPKGRHNDTDTSTRRPQEPSDISRNKSGPCEPSAKEPSASASAETADVDKGPEINRSCIPMDTSYHREEKTPCVDRIEHSMSPSLAKSPGCPLEEGPAIESANRRLNQASAPSSTRSKYGKTGKNRWHKHDSGKHLWTSACRALSDKVQEDILLNSAVTLMMKMWTDYLNLTFEEVRQREIATARELNQCDEVIEMLEDKDRYVWQIIEDIKPKTCLELDGESMEYL